MTREYCREAHWLMHKIDDLDFIITKLGEIKTGPAEIKTGPATVTSIFTTLNIRGLNRGPAYERLEFSESFEVSPETLDVIIKDVIKQREQLQEKFAKL